MSFLGGGDSFALGAPSGLQQHIPYQFAQQD